jgi:RND family efflux transporter MFP subunit
MTKAQWVRPAREAARAAIGLELASAAALLLAACSPPAPPPAPPATVVAAPPLVESAPSSFSYAGEVRARYESPLAFRVDGKLVARPAHLGDWVRAGQLLARIDPGDSAASLAAARAALAAAENRLVLARQSRDRNAAQRQEDLVSQADAEQSDSGFAVAQAEVEQRRQELALAGNQAQYTDLVADHDGLITSENADVGAVLKAGQAVLALAWTGESDVLIDVPENRIGTITPGQVATVLLAGDSAMPVRARVRDIAHAADPQSRTFRVKLALEQPQRARLGTTAAVSLSTAAATPRVSVPASALFHAGNAAAVWVVRPADHTLELRKIDVAAYGSDTVRVASGLDPADTVVVLGVHAVNAGERVSVVAPRPESESLIERP